MIKTIYFLKKLTAAEVGIKETHEVYIRLPNDFDFESFFPTMAKENGTVIQVDFSAKNLTVGHEKDENIALKFVYYANSNKEKRIPSLGSFFNDNTVKEGDVVCLESRQSNGITDFYITFTKAHLASLNPASVTYSIIKESEPNKVNPQKVSLQTIYYGAPGTGKSHKVNEITNDANSVRTTFHPDSDYSTFVGAYKPTTQPVKLRDLSGHVVIENGEEVIDERIVYKFVPQAFLHAYVNAWKNQNEPYYLVIEEINRGNCAQIFGDLFQLLDRGSDGESSYSIKPDKDIATFLANDKLGFKDAENIPEEIRKGTEMRLPANLHILATMNTSDQSLFPIDSAFKRRWDWEYVPIEDAGKGHFIAIGEKKYDWWNFISIINGKIDVLSGSEDKKMGYWFVKPTEGSKEISSKQFLSKVLFYLWNDIYKDYADSSQSIFKITENGQPVKTPFTSFFGYNSEKRMQAFMEYNGIDSIDVSNDSELDEEPEPTDGTSKDYSKYAINGQGQYAKRRAVYEMVSMFCSNHPELTAVDIKKQWLSLGVDIQHFIETADDFERRTKDSKDENKRATEIHLNSGESIFVSTQINSTNFADLMAKVNKQDWQIVVSQA